MLQAKNDAKYNQIRALTTTKLISLFNCSSWLFPTDVQFDNFFSLWSDDFFLWSSSWNVEIKPKSIHEFKCLPASFGYLNIKWIGRRHIFIVPMVDWASLTGRIRYHPPIHNIKYRWFPMQIPPIVRFWWQCHWTSEFYVSHVGHKTLIWKLLVCANNCRSQSKSN